MDNQKEVLPLRIIAARFISSNELEGLAELDRITADVYGLIQTKYLVWWIAFSAALFASAITLLPGIGLTLAGVKGGEIVAAIGLIPFGLLLAVVSYWRILQYGSMRASQPQKAVYANPDDPAARNLERLFALLQLETTPRAFYVTRNGVKRYINERYFFGSLRAAYVSKESPVREVLFAPIGFWFSREIFMDVDVDALIAQAKAKPNRGAPKTYDYTDAVMSLIEHPVVRAIDVNKRGNQTQIADLLEDWYRTKGGSIPSRTQLSLYAKLILEVIAKNRAAKS
ncbi:hypothetical protein [Sphingomonas bacterium]|uniref:hypothetical protein n=1 Tax=Sphingomonas bacterium TaxID=1895847 RepID=UPI0015756B2A|nr:hypothetical protein [Sphingomonas bacterium]